MNHPHVSSLLRLSHISSIVSLILIITGLANMLIRWTVLKARFDNVKNAASPTEAHHIAAIAQEVSLCSIEYKTSWQLGTGQAFLLFIIETIRFKNQMVVKQNKFGTVSDPNIPSRHLSSDWSFSLLLISRTSAQMLLPFWRISLQTLMIGLRPR